MFGISAQYTSTASTIAAAFAKTSFDADHQRLVVLAVGGVIKNDYQDFLGTGQQLKSEDDLRVFATRYLYRVWDDWFVGLQGIYTNYVIVGQTALDDQVLNTLGLTGFKSGGRARSSARFAQQRQQPHQGLGPELQQHRLS